MSIRDFQVAGLVMQMKEALEELKKPGLTEKDRKNIAGTINLLKDMADQSDLEFVDGTAEVRDIQQK